jgi:hypothetical protein
MQLQGAGHVLTAAKWGFNLPVTIRTLRDLHFRAIALGELVVHEGFVTMGTGRIYSHSTLVTLISRHRILQSQVQLDRVTWGAYHPVKCDASETTWTATIGRSMVHHGAPAPSSTAPGTLARSTGIAGCADTLFLR